VGAVVLPLRNGWLTSALSWRPLAALGVASYSLYMWHVLLVRRLSDQFFLANFPKLLLIAMPICIAVAFASYALVERPFLLWRRRWAAAPVDRQGRTYARSVRTDPPRAPARDQAA
jgi:peptidoglycan/LPS O-acetylase OafA/YrhL